MEDNEVYATFWGHIEELRKTLLKVAAIIIIAVLISFIFYRPLITFLTAPLGSFNKPNILREELLEQKRVYNHSTSNRTFTLPEEALPPFVFTGEMTPISERTYSLQPGSSISYSKTKPDSQLVLLTPLEGISTAIKMSFWIGCTVSSPLWFFVLLQFIAPALKPAEKSLIWPFVLLSILFLAGGSGFAYAISIPLANAYFSAFNADLGFNLWSLSHYLDYTLFFLLAHALAFELALFGFFAVHLGLISDKTLLAKRPFAIVTAFILGALLTPPDVITQIALALPLIILYELLILYSKLTPKHISFMR